MSHPYRHKLVLMLGDVCQDCKQSFPIACYDLHHLNQEEKEYAIGELFGLAWEHVELEAKKCVLLCSNCHRIRHHGPERANAEIANAATHSALRQQRKKEKQEEKERERMHKRYLKDPKLLFEDYHRQIEAEAYAAKREREDLEDL